MKENLNCLKKKMNQYSLNKKKINRIRFTNSQMNQIYKRIQASNSMTSFTKQ